MKCTIPEISWHNRDPVLSVDVQPLTNEGFYRLATGGTDSHVLIWNLKILETGATTTEPVSDLTRHQRAVNVVRWSYSGQYLASGDDDANIIIWHQKSDDLAVMLDGENDDKEKWSALKVLRGHKEDVYDICWSPDSSKLISGSVDNTAIIWNLAKGLNDNILTDHKGFVQGVTWDPLGQYIATLSSDRICRVFTETGKQVKARLKKGQLQVPESHALHGQVVRYFHDDTLKSFFRRLTFSPDGNFIITPAGCLEFGPNNKKLYTSYIYATSSLTQPAAILPSPGQYTVAARCCPILFQLRPDGPDPLVSLPYRMIFAIASRSSVILYDTQQMAPFATISNIHYTRLTDLAWSQDGRLLAVSSTDGFCSLVTFEPDELGVEYVKETEVVEQDSNETLSETVEEVMDTSLNISVDEKKEKKPSFLEKWTKRAQSNEEKDKVVSEKPISRIEVRRKVKPGTSNAEKEIKEEKPVSVLEVRRKPKELIENKQENVKNAVKVEKPISRIEVRRKPKETAENKEKSNEVLIEKPISRIEIRRTSKSPTEKQEEKSKDTQEKLENIQDKLKNNQDKSEINEAKSSKKEFSAKVEKSKENLDEPSMKKIKIRNEEKSSTSEVDDDVMIIETENEKENKNKENVLKKKSPSEKENNTASTPKRGPKPGVKNPQNSTPAKQILVRRKPREPPGGQLNITQFLKSPKPTPSKTKEPNDSQDSKMNPFILIQDYNKTGKTYANRSKVEVILLDDESSTETPPSVSQVLNFEEDSQDIKLVLEDTVDDPMNKPDDETEKMEVDNDNLNNKERNRSENDTKSSQELTEKLVNGDTVNSKDTEEINLKDTEETTNKEINSEDTEKATNKGIISDDTKEVTNKEINSKEEASNKEINSADTKKASNKVINSEVTEGYTNKEINSGDTKATNKEINSEGGEEINVDIKTENCDRKECISKSLVEEKLTPLLNVLSLPKGSPAKKRVPLITLSSPKHKNKPF